MEKTVTVAGNVFCKDCPNLGHVKSTQEICIWDCSDVALAEANKVYALCSKAGIKTPDQHFFIFPDYQCNQNKLTEGLLPPRWTLLEAVAINSEKPSLLMHPPEEQQEAEPEGSSSDDESNIPTEETKESGKK